MPTDSKTAEIVARLRANTYMLHSVNADDHREVEQRILPDCAEAADLLESNAREIEQLEKERDEAVSRADELEANAEQVSVEFEKQCWQALRTLMTECGFEWGYIPPEGVTAEHALEYLREALADIRAAARDVTTRASALEAERDKLREGLLRAAWEIGSPLRMSTDEAESERRARLVAELRDLAHSAASGADKGGPTLPILDKAGE